MRDEGEEESKALFAHQAHKVGAGEDEALASSPPFHSFIPLRANPRAVVYFNDSSKGN